MRKAHQLQNFKHNFKWSLLTHTFPLKWKTPRKMECMEKKKRRKKKQRRRKQKEEKIYIRKIERETKQHMYLVVMEALNAAKDKRAKRVPILKNLTRSSTVRAF